MYVLLPTHLPKRRHARPVNVSHGAAVNDDVADVSTSSRRFIVLFSIITILANTLSILEHVPTLQYIVNCATYLGMCCINAKRKNMVFSFSMNLLCALGFF